MGRLCREADRLITTPRGFGVARRRRVRVQRSGLRRNLNFEKKKKKKKCGQGVDLRAHTHDIEAIVIYPTMNVRCCQVAPPLLGMEGRVGC